MTLNRSICALEHIWWPSLFNVHRNLQFLRLKNKYSNHRNCFRHHNRCHSNRAHDCFPLMEYFVLSALAPNECVSVHCSVIVFKYYQLLNRSNPIDVLLKLFQLSRNSNSWSLWLWEVLINILVFTSSTLFFRNSSEAVFSIESSLAPCDTHKQ